MTMKKKLYLVQRLSWCTAGAEDLQRGIAENHIEPEGVPILAFTREAAASARAKQLTAEARRELNPFQFMYNDVESIMHGDEEALLLALGKMDLPFVALKRYPTNYSREIIDWPAWYDDIADDLTDAERDAIWNLLDRLELYRVVEVEFL